MKEFLLLLGIIAMDANSSVLSTSSLPEKFTAEKILSSSSFVRLFDREDFPEVSQCLAFVKASLDTSRAAWGPILCRDGVDDSPEMLVMTVEIILRITSPLYGGFDDSNSEGICIGNAPVRAYEFASHEGPDELFAQVK